MARELLLDKEAFSLDEETRLAIRTKLSSTLSKKPFYLLGL